MQVPSAAIRVAEWSKVLDSMYHPYFAHYVSAYEASGSCIWMWVRIPPLTKCFSSTFLNLFFPTIIVFQFFLTIPNLPWVHTANYNNIINNCICLLWQLRSSNQPSVIVRGVINDNFLVYSIIKQNNYLSIKRCKADYFVSLERYF